MTAVLKAGMVSVALFVGVLSAQAADLAPAYKAPPPAVAVPYNWTGFYVGLNGGYGWGGSFRNRTDTTTISGASSYDAGIAAGNSGVFGAQLGFNKQFSHFVVSLETDLDWANFTGSRTDTWCTPSTCGYTARTTTDAKLDWLGTTRGRVGYAFENGTLLPYVTGGIAYGGITTSMIDHCPTCTSSSLTHNFGVGWAAGAGVEWAALASMPDLTLRVEYLHIDLQGPRYDYAAAGISVSNKTGVAANIVRAGLNYHF